MRYFPLFHDTQSLSVLIVGGGEVAARKLALWSRSQARLVVVSPSIAPAIADLVKQGRVRHLAQFYQASQLEGHGGVIAATNDPALNRTISEQAQAAGLWVNVVDDPDACSVLTPAIVDRTPVTVAIGSEGGAPVLVRAIRSLLEQVLPSSLGRLAEFVSEQRARVMKEHAKPRSIWEAFIANNGLGWQEDTPESLAKAEAGEPSEGGIWVIAEEQAPSLLPVAAMSILQSLDRVYFVEEISDELEPLLRRDAERHRIGLEQFEQLVLAKEQGLQSLLVLQQHQLPQWRQLLGDNPIGYFETGNLSLSSVDNLRDE